MRSLEDLALGPAGAGETEDDAVKRALKTARSHLGMEIAYVSEFVEDDSVFREVDAPGLHLPVKPGDRRTLDEVYCRHILRGRMPELIPDTSKLPLARRLPITREIGIGSHMSVPIRLEDGRIYGMFCCLSAKPDPSLTERDLQVMRAFADMAAHEISREVMTREAADRKRREIENVIDTRQFAQVFQPIWNFTTPSIAGFECLTRFPSVPNRTPDVWFNTASEVGLGPALEVAVIEALMSAKHGLADDVYVTFNASPAAVLSDEFSKVLATVEPNGLVLEITEHAPVEDYAELMRVVTPLREKGLKLAVDDAGAGYASLQHIVQLRPDIIKLDMSLTRGVDTDPALRALTAALIFFSRETGCQILAEGVETQNELRTLKTLGVNRGQGYLLGRPISLDLASDLLRQENPLDRIMAARSA